MSAIRLRTIACVLATLVLSACGGGGGGDSGGSSLYVNVSYGTPTVFLWGQSTVTPTLSGFEGHAPHCSLQSGSLPPGMVLNTDCTLTGRPMAAGTFGFNVLVGVSGYQGTVTATSTLWVYAPTIYYHGHAGYNETLPVGMAVNDSPYVPNWYPSSDVVPTWTYVVHDGSLPPGLSLDPATGVISGNVSAQGAFTAGIQATVSSAYGTYVLPVASYAANVDITGFSYLDWKGFGNDGGYFRAYVGVDYTALPQPSGNNTLSNFHVVSGSLPAGLTVDAVSGNVVGRPQAVTAPTVVGVGATTTISGVSNPTQVNFDVEVLVPFTVDWGSPAVAQVGSAYTLNPSTTFARDSLGNSVTTYAQTSMVATPRAGACNLPPGLTMNSWGQVTGTPSAAGSFGCAVDFSLTVNGVTWTQPTQLDLTVQ